MKCITQLIDLKKKNVKAILNRVCGKMSIIAHLLYYKCIKSTKLKIRHQNVY